MEKEIELEQEAIVVYSGGGAVDSVNGYTGDVVLTTSDLENTSDYQTGTEVESAISTAIAGKQDTLTAGNNITISNNTISATDTTYSAGTGLTLDGTQFSVNTETIATQQDVSNEATARENADTNLQGQIDAISASSDVTDIVGTYADLQAYDTTHLKDNDIIKVLQDESQNDETTYYRWSTSTQTFTLIGEEGPYYTKSQTDTLLQAKQDNLTAGANITIASDNTISATDTTYSDFTGTDGTTAGTAGLVPAPATTDAGKFLGASGLWEAVQAGGVTELTSADYNYPTDNPDRVLLGNLSAGIYYRSNSVRVGVPTELLNANQNFFIIMRSSGNTTVYANILGPSGSSNNGIYQDLQVWMVSGNTGSLLDKSGALSTENLAQATGTSTTNVMSQNAVTSMVYADPSTKSQVQLGSTSSASGAGAISIGQNSSASGTGGVAVGYNGTLAGGYGAVAIGRTANATGRFSVALAGSSTSTQGTFAVGLETRSTLGYNNSQYRLLTGLYDGQNAHDAATYGQVISYSAINGAGAPTTATEGKYVGQLYYDTTNEAMYFLKTIDTTTDPDTYTWEALGGGSSVNVVQTTGTSTTDVMSQNAVTSMVFKDPASGWNVRIGKNANTLNNGVAIGIRAYSGGNGVAMGMDSTSSSSDFGIAIGNEANSATSGSIALGAFSGGSSNITSAGIMHIGSSNTSYGYNSSNYRLLTGLYDGQSDHDAATKGQLDSIAIQNAGAPTTATVGTVGQLLEDTTNGKLYICTDTTGGTYTWEEVGAGGGGGPTVVQSTGTSTTDVMSQNAVTSMVFKNPSTLEGVRIGKDGVNVPNGTGTTSIGDALTNGNRPVAIGNGSLDATYRTRATGDDSVAIGTSASVLGYKGGIALGAYSNVSSVGEMNIGSTSTTYGYNNSNYRLLTGLYDPQSAHDAATKGYVDPTTDSSAPTTATVGRLGQIQIDTTTATAYMCVAVDTVTPAYTWKQITV